MNIFRLIGDILHAAAIIFLIYQIIQKKCCKGISGKTQILMLMVYVTRYVDLFMYYVSFYNSFMKVAYVCSSVLIIFLIYHFYKNENEKQNDYFKAEFLVFISLIAAIYFNNDFIWDDMLWMFSVSLEAVAIIPQMHMIFMTCEMTYTVKGYLLLMGPYRGFYIYNWIYRYLYENSYPEQRGFICGLVQELIYIIFLIVYKITSRRFSKTLETGDTDVITENESNLKNNLTIYSLNLDPKSLDLSSKTYKHLPTVHT